MRGETPWLESDSGSSEDGTSDPASHLSTNMARISLRDNQNHPHRQTTSPSDEGYEKLWELRSTPCKGIGMFARTNISGGTRLLADQCLLHLPGPKTLLIDIERAVGLLSPSQQEAYMKLHCPDRPGRSPIVRIWEANCFKVDEGAGIFLKASRINHSCMPNAHFAWNATIQRETVHAIVDIPANAEITISYCPPHSDLYHRRRKLEPYGFDCDCPPCAQDTASSQDSEARRCQMEELFQEITKIQENPWYTATRQWCDNELQARLRLIGLLEKEKLFQLELGNQYHCVATCYEYLRDREKALKYAKEGARINLTCVGPDSEILKSDRARIQELKGGYS